MPRLDGVTTNRLRYLGILAFAFLIWYVGPRNLLQALAGTRFSYLFAALVLNLPLIALKTWRWQVLLLGVGIRLPFVAAFRAYAVGIFVGCLTPGRLGEFIKVAYVTQNSGEETGKALPSVLIDRLYDLYLLLVLGLIGLFHYSLAGDQPALLTLTLLAGVLFGLPALISTPRLGNWLRQSPAFARLKASWRETLLEIHTQLASLTCTTLVRGFGLTAGAYLVFFFQCQLGAWGTGLRVPFLDLVLVMAITNLLTLLPVSISGIGVRDVSLVVLLARFGIGQAQAVAFSLAILVIFYVGGIFLGSICWIWEPVKLKAVSLGGVPCSGRENKSGGTIEGNHFNRKIS
jgi:glycosyltransferase 2 family protein